MSQANMIKARVSPKHKGVVMLSTGMLSREWQDCGEASDGAALRFLAEQGVVELEPARENGRFAVKKEK